jgi:hypothetical protein
MDKFAGETTMNIVTSNYQIFARYVSHNLAPKSSDGPARRHEGK